MPSQAPAHFIILLATLAISTTFPIGQRIAPQLDPVLIVLYRFVLCVFFMSPLLFTNKIKIPSPRRLVQFAVIGACYSGFFICMFSALRQTTSLNTSVIYTLVPALAAIVSFVILGERLKGLHFSLLGLGIGSTLWVLFQGSWSAITQFHFNPGDLLFGSGCILTALYSTLIKKFHVQESPFNLAFWSMVCGSVLLGIYAWVTSVEFVFTTIPTEVALWVLYLAVMTVFTSFAWSYGTPKLGSAHTLAYSYLIPSFVLVINWLAFGSLPPLIVLPGVLSGVGVMVVLQRKS